MDSLASPASALYVRAMLSRMALATALCALMAACSPGAPPAAPDTDPSSPHAAAGVVPPLASANATAMPAAHAHATAYVCPMHPEVTSSEPGTCPTCHMTLVHAR